MKFHPFSVFILFNFYFVLFFFFFWLHSHGFDDTMVIIKITGSMLDRRAPESGNYAELQSSTLMISLLFLSCSCVAV